MPLKIDLEVGGLRGCNEVICTPDGRLSFKRKLGKGAEGSVYLAVPTGLQVPPSPSSCQLEQILQSPVAVKVVTGDAFQRYRQTRHLWPTLEHPHIVFPREATFDDRNGLCFVEMELCDTDLLDMVMRHGPLSDRRAALFAAHLSSALAHLHSQGIAHQDVKLENIFVRDGIAKLGDLGSIVEVLARIPTDIHSGSVARTSGVVDDCSAEPISPCIRQVEVVNSSPSPFACSTSYAPPEAFKGIKMKELHGVVCGNTPCSREPCARKQHQAFASDMWALGITLYAAVAKRHPWERASKSCAKFRRFVRGGSERFFPTTFSPGLKSLLSRLLSLDPTKRPTSAEVLASQWVSSITPKQEQLSRSTTVGMKALSSSQSIPATPVTPTDGPTCVTLVNSSPRSTPSASVGSSLIPLSSVSMPKQVICSYRQSRMVFTAAARASRATRLGAVVARDISADSMELLSREFSGEILGRSSMKVARITPSPSSSPSPSLLSDSAIDLTGSPDVLPKFIASPSLQSGMKRPVPSTARLRARQGLFQGEPAAKRRKLFNNVHRVNT